MQSHSKRPLGAFGSASCAIWKICSPSPSASFLSRSASSRTFCSSLETTEPAVVLPMRLAAWLSFRILLQLRWRPETRSRVTSASSSRLLASPDTVRESDWIWFLMVFRDVKAIDDTSPSDFTDVVTAYSSALISAIFRWSVEARAFPLSLVDSSRSLGRVGPLCGVRSCAHAASSAVTASSEGSAERRASCIFASRPESRSASATSRRTSASWPTSGGSSPTRTGSPASRRRCRRPCARPSPRTKPSPRCWPRARSSGPRTRAPPSRGCASCPRGSRGTPSPPRSSGRSRRSTRSCTRSPRP
mmetsp:Transcript_17970/g.44009  ORF Transcript_17970/g.44009 Transcript_17970/m.44009 type:complete len:303 (-) Transcript_17970:3451-4359(-)